VSSCACSCRDSWEIDKSSSSSSSSSSSKIVQGRHPVGLYSRPPAPWILTQNPKPLKIKFKYIYLDKFIQNFCWERGEVQLMKTNKSTL
jgi:hypothetical protein